MNRIIITILTIAAILTISSCAEKTEKETKAKTEELVKNESFDWLLGFWKRNNETEGKETFEVWTKNNNSDYLGIGFTMQNNDTINQENIKLYKLERKWILEVQMPNETDPTRFNVTSYNEQEFICENAAHDFPTLIKYWKNGDKLNALVSGDEMEIAFEFEKIKAID